jgi:hypothetical protein
MENCRWFSQSDVVFGFSEDFSAVIMVAFGRIQTSIYEDISVRDVCGNSQDLLLIVLKKIFLAKWMQFIVFPVFSCGRTSTREDGLWFDGHLA